VGNNSAAIGIFTGHPAIIPATFFGFSLNMIFVAILIALVDGLHICNDDIQCDLDNPKQLTICIQNMIDSCFRVKICGF